MTKVTLTLDAVINEDGNIQLTCSGFYNELVYKVPHGCDPEKELCMLGVNTLPLAELDSSVDESSMAQVINKSNPLMAEVKRLRSKLT